MQGSKHSGFLALDGTAKIHRDQTLIEELWDPIMKTWFTEGKDDARITVIEFVPEAGYYWDNKHGNLVAATRMILGAAIGRTLDDSIEGRGLWPRCCPRWPTIPPLMSRTASSPKHASRNIAASLLLGTAGWGLPRASQHRFASADPADSHLKRYARSLPAVEINSSFYRPHQRTTYEHWAATTPPAFRFSAKLPRSITHTAGLRDSESLLQAFLEQVYGLGERLGCLLVQLPPSLSLDIATANDFFGILRRLHGEGGVAVEPRHASWFSPQGDALLAHWQVARVLADPVLHDPGRIPGGWSGLVYCRLHGSPRVYYSAYDTALIDALAHRLVAAAHEAESVWCIFDNTASGAAAENALDLVSASVACEAITNMEPQ